MRWLDGSLSGGEGIVSVWGRLCLTLSYSLPGRRGWRTVTVVEGEAKGGFVANSKEVK